MLIRDRENFQKIGIWLLILAVVAAFIILPDFGPFAILPEIPVLIAFLEIVYAIQLTSRQHLCAASHFEIQPRSPPTFGPPHPVRFSNPLTGGLISMQCLERRVTRYPRIRFQPVTLLKRLFGPMAGNPIEYGLGGYWRMVERIKALDLSGMTNAQFAERTRQIAQLVRERVSDIPST